MTLPACGAAAPLMLIDADMSFNAVLKMRAPQCNGHNWLKAKGATGLKYSRCIFCWREVKVNCTRSVARRMLAKNWQRTSQMS